MESTEDNRKEIRTMNIVNLDFFAIARARRMLKNSIKEDMETYERRCSIIARSKAQLAFEANNSFLYTVSSIRKEHIIPFCKKYNCNFELKYDNAGHVTNWRFSGIEKKGENSDDLSQIIDLLSTTVKGIEIGCFMECYRR